MSNLHGEIVKRGHSVGVSNWINTRAFKNSMGEIIFVERDSTWQEGNLEFAYLGHGITIKIGNGSDLVEVENSFDFKQIDFYSGSSIDVKLFLEKNSGKKFIKIYEPMGDSRKYIETNFDTAEEVYRNLKS